MAPDGIGRQRFIIPTGENLRNLDENRHREKLLEAALIPEVLDVPLSVWEDLISGGKKGWLCYSGRPSGNMIRNVSINVPCPPQQVFAIYIRDKPAKHGQRIVDWWEWVPCDGENKDFPANYATRYGRRLWPQTLTDSTSI